MEFSFVIYIYPGVEDYLPRLIVSLNEQTVKYFQVVIFNDGLKNVKNLFQPLRLEYIIQDISGSPGEIRYKSLEFIERLDSEFIVFQDADDFPDSNRLEEVKKAFKDYDLVVNDLTIVDKDNMVLKPSLWSNRLGNYSEFDKEFIRDKNIVGLGNSAIKRSLLNRSNIKFTEKPIAFDWFLFYQILDRYEIKAVFLSTTRTNYRQHGDNLAGVQEPGMRRCKYVLEVKKMHYKALQEIGYDFDSVLKNLQEIEEKLSQSDNYKIHTKENNLFWWEETNLLKYEKNEIG